MTQPDTFMTHLIELRDRLLRSIIAVVVIFACLYPWAQEIFEFLAKPMLAHLPAGSKLISTEVTGPFFVPMKVTLLAAVVVALPFLLYQLWAFVAPGLYAHEKRLIGPLVISSTALFLCGMAFAYYFVFNVVFRFLSSVAPHSVAVSPDIGKYLDFVLTMFIAFGVTFEVPVAVILLVKMGAVSITKLKEMRPYVIVGAFVIGAIFTPPDIVSQIMLAVPLCLLYEAGILVAKLINKPSSDASLEISNKNPPSK